MSNTIGGYFELETPSKESFLHSNLIATNTGRNALEYILRLRCYHRIYLPYFTCSVLLEPINKLNIAYSFYDVNNQLEPCFDYTVLKQDDAVLLTNYFGLKSNYIRDISKSVRNIIVDNAQALFERPFNNIDTIYSPRKFVGVADGGYVATELNKTLMLENDISYNRMDHLLIRADIGAEAGYKYFQQNDIALQNQPIKKMSSLTRNILASLDYITIANRRRQNFEYLHEALKKKNQLTLKLEDYAIPMVYPYRTENAFRLRKKLHQNRIFCATYWPNVLKWSTALQNAFHLTQEIIALPIDQRYTINDMKSILEYV